MFSYDFKKKIYSKYKIPPHSIESEQSILGGVIISNNKLDKIIEKIDKNDFFSNQHKIIFNEIVNLFNNNKPIDLITLSESLKSKKLLENVGGFLYLAELSKNTPSIINILEYCEIIKEKSISRKIIEISNYISDICYNNNGLRGKELLDLLESKIFKISEKVINNNKGPQKINKFLNITLKKIKELNNNTDKITGIKTGYIDLDKKTLGFQKSDLIILAARPSMGKTTFAINLCEYSFLNLEKPILIFSLEVPVEQIIIKILSSLSKINQINIRTGNLNKLDWVKLFNVIDKLIKKNNIYIDDSSSLTITEIKTRARKVFKENNGINIIMIDYLQLIKVPTLSENRNMEITEISRSLKSLAKELNVPIIALSQLNRSLEQRLDKRPVNSDLRESGSIEQDADLIIFIYRDEVYKENIEKGIAEIIIGKHRNGPTGSFKLIFNKKYSRFDNYINKF